jgi:hypothetical protein
MNSPLSSPQVPVNRQLVGVLALVCVGIAGVFLVTGAEGPSELWQGAFFRVGIVLAAFWLALPSRTREAAWARISLWNLVGVLAVILLVARARVPLKLLVPGALVFALALTLLRPRRKSRPAHRLFD